MDAVWKADCGIINCFQFPPCDNDREISSVSWESVFYWTDYLLFEVLMCMCVQNSEAECNSSSVIRAHIHFIVSVSPTLTFLFVIFHRKCLCGLCHINTKLSINYIVFIFYGHFMNTNFIITVHGCQLPWLSDPLRSFSQNKKKCIIVYVVYLLFHRCIFNILHEKKSIIVTFNGASVVQNSYWV